MNETANNVSEWKGGWYVVPYHVLLRDLDSFGHVNHAVFLTYFEWARTLFWFALTGGKTARDINFIAARAECDYLQQLGLEPIEIRVRIGTMRNTSMDFLHEIRKSNGRDIAAAGKVVVVMFDYETQSKVAITEEFRRKVTAFQGSET
jgi:acyl-CoA thioester hydrolase